MLTDKGQNDAEAHLRALDQRHTLHPWTHFDSFEKEGAMVVESGEGCYLKDANGKSYLDAVGGMWCTNIGLGRKEMAQTIAEQVEKLAYSSTFVDMTNGPSALLAEKLASLTPGDLNRMHFTTGGSTAVDSAYRLVGFYNYCRGKPEKTHIIARDQAYHGSTFVTMSIGNKAADKVTEFQYLRDGIHHISAPHFYRAEGNPTEEEFTDQLIAEFEAKIAEIGADKVAAFFAEPIQASGGVLVPPKGYLKRMWEVCQKHDILFLADEVVTAFGRLGHFFAIEDEFDVVPDIITTAKGLSSGYLPMGAMIYSDRIHDVISKGDENRWFTSGYTYSGHPVCCAAALKNIEIMERENLLQNAADVGTYFEEQLNTLNDLEIVGNVRGRKLMMCVENVKNKATKELFPDEVDIGKRIATTAESLGLLVRPIGHLNVMSPPLTLTRKDVDFLVKTLRTSIEKVTKQLREEGHF
ncbi:aminotransferase [Neptunicoccus sediminis]|uniref:aminotransferase n=1 Tax=Neptunicoccus sediminis TaxID=1892596 RepID=UPI000845BD53|nr:aminotransferase [Neptunicoccus sediminis]